MDPVYSSIRFRSAPRPGVRYVSGKVVFDEMFAEGRLVTRYWNSNGQVLPEMYFEKLTWEKDQPTGTFQLGINGQDLAGGYTWETAGIEPDSSPYRVRKNRDGGLDPIHHCAVTLKHPDAGIQVKVHTRLDGSSIIIRWLEITNLNSYPVGITAVSPFSGLFWSHRFEEHLSPQFSSPFEVAYTHQFTWGHEGDFWFEPLPAGIKRVDGGTLGRSGWGRPAFWAHNRCNGQTFVCELAWGGNYEFELDCRMHDIPGTDPFNTAARWGELYFKMGLSGQHPVLRALDAGETLVTPAVHLGLFHEDPDAIIQATHDHVRQVVMPAQIPGRQVEIEANHRGYLCDRENVPDIIKDVDVAASLGVEMYVIDAGWYGNEPNQWGNNVGDWRDGSWLAKDGGLKAIVDYVHQQGLKFGLWVEIEAAGANSNLRKEHPEWLLRCNGDPVSGGRALDLSQPVVAAWVEGEIERIIQTYHLDMYRIDHNHCLDPSGNRLYQGFTEDLTWRYYDAFNAIFDRLRARYPEVVFQNCAGGGGRLDWGTLARFHNTELSDWMRLPRGLKILNGVTASLPPEILLRTFGTEVGEHALDGDLDAQLRLCFSRVIFRGVAPSLDDLTPYLQGRIEHYLDLYKKQIRPVMIGGLVFHHTPFLEISKVTPWCALEYARPDRSESVAVVFKTGEVSGSDFPDEYLFLPRGLDVNRAYRVVMDNSGQEFSASGFDLTQKGMLIRLEANLSSELILINGL